MYIICSVPREAHDDNPKGRTTPAHYTILPSPPIALAPIVSRYLLLLLLLVIRCSPPTIRRRRHTYTVVKPRRRNHVIAHI